MVVEVRYTYRLRPGQTARRYLAREWGMCRMVWNSLVERSADEHMWNQIALDYGAARDELPTFGYADQDKHLTRLRRTTVDDNGVYWLAEGSSVAQQQTGCPARSIFLSSGHATSPPPRSQRGCTRTRSGTGTSPSL